MNKNDLPILELFNIKIYILFTKTDLTNNDWLHPSIHLLPLNWGQNAEAPS